MSAAFGNLLRQRAAGRLIAMAAMAMAIFIADTITRREIAVAVFYVAVVLLAIGVFRARGVLWVAAGCMGLTVISFLLTRSGAAQIGAVNFAISLIAIAVTARLGLQSVSATEAMHEARVQLTHVARVMSLGELTTSIAHEVNQPLAAIMTSGDAGLRWLAAQPPNIDRARAALERIVGDASRASTVITRVRSLARRVPPTKGRSDLNEAIEEIVGLTRSEIEHNGIDLNLALDPDLPRVHADRIQIQQVVLNLVLNAIDAMRAVGGRERALTIVTRADGTDAVRITVRDSGSGMESAQAEHLFDPFFTTKKEGLGMGLTISRSIVEAHGGRIWADPSPPGTVFQVSLPVNAEGAS